MSPSRAGDPSMKDRKRQIEQAAGGLDEIGLALDQLHAKCPGRSLEVSLLPRALGGQRKAKVLEAI